MRLQQYGRLTDYKKVGDFVHYGAGSGRHRLDCSGTIVRFLPANGGAILRINSIHEQGEEMMGYKVGDEINAGVHEIDF